jgi:hypothetical protein
MATGTHVCLHVVSRIIVGLNPKLEYVKESQSTAPVPGIMKIRRGGSVIVWICQDGRTDIQSNVVVPMSSFVELHDANGRNDSQKKKKHLYYRGISFV